MIIASAIKLSDGRVFVGKRHGDCFKAIVFFTGDRMNRVGSTQGFINDKLQFLDRGLAYLEALENKQCEKKEYYWLASEDLW
jgi:hypothetical protein